MVSQDLIDNLLAEITRQQKVIEHQTELLKKQHIALRLASKGRYAGAAPAAVASTQLDGISTKASTTEILGALDNPGEQLAHITKLMRQK
jgi:hypothetical protein